MADEGESAGRGIGSTLSHKVGPLPLGVWLVAAVGIWWYLRKKQAATSTSAPIDPVTGYPTGSAQDQSALAAENAAGSTGSGSSSTSGSTTAGQYADNNAWSRAAINYLVGIGIDPVEANSAITQYVSSQPLSTQQQADVNLAVQGIGGPPEPPTPGTTPSPIVTPPSPGPVYAANPPTGLTVSGKTSNTLSVKWNASTNATGYTVTYSTGSQAPQSTTASGTATSATLPGLSPNTLYTVQVQATPAKPTDGFASTSATTAAAASSAGSAPPSGAGQTHPYKVVHGDTLSGIAASHHTDLATVKKLNPVYWTNPKYNQGNEIFAGDTVILPGAG